jgi:hypothetical protein
MNDDKVATLVNDLRRIAVKYKDTQMLREVISKCVKDALHEDRVHEKSLRSKLRVSNALLKKYLDEAA